MEKARPGAAEAEANAVFTVSVAEARAGRFRAVGIVLGFSSQGPVEAANTRVAIAEVAVSNA
eukprot:617514-Lingulodinium_polyedra.AAC.1